MENASQALIIAGAILLAILIIAIGMYIYNSASANITDSLSNLSSSEIEAFNSNFETYRGTQTGAQVSSLIGRLIANATTYAEEEGRKPDVVFYSSAENSTTASHSAITDLGNFKNKVENKHKYYVTFEYSDSTGLISKVTINYNKPADDQTEP